MSTTAERPCGSAASWVGNASPPELLTITSDADQLGRAPAHLADVAHGRLGIARHEECGEHGDDQQVEQDGPADDEPGDIAERAPHDHR